LIDGYAFGQQLTGVSEGRFPDGGTNIVAFPGTDSPGAPNYRRLTEIVINEVLTHTDEPLEDAIELHNLTAQRSPSAAGGSAMTTARSKNIRSLRAQSSRPLASRYSTNLNLPTAIWPRFPSLSVRMETRPCSLQPPTMR